ncbi:sulfate adenylyltransferase (ADP) / ATP adenylyltransferase [Geosmithia morbida]|uniref:Sulfate adenylyltransferase (ADP) / ATP adenylyltransferase n=1 Tax=Geosmithia morbida TaxID=1094350 RepID=A0A9P4YP99_9HYPO|nr:sulfate adenylyltransferase (ADP) / ATP adenylyltransferase [Geosmithia morbida]KAF4119304.1 sulfate adenylyltransferase (ADP) / ATP adenylyltransferase [Geosmithia morbida]
MRDGLEQGGGAWSVLVDGLGSPSARPPFAVFTESINLDTSEGELHDAYIRLYRRAVSAATDGQRGDAPDEGETLVSYNLAMTKSTLALVPRVAEGGRVTDDKGDVVGSLALNGTVLAGTALVKSEAEWDALRGNKDELAAILSHIGIPVEKVRL